MGEDSSDSGGHDAKRPIGRGNPPRRSQFGAGNGGRPRGSKNKKGRFANLPAALTERFAARYSIKENGKKIRRTGTALVSHGLFHGMVKQRPSIMKIGIQLLQQDQHRRERQIRDMSDTVAAYQAYAYGEIDACRRLGLPPPVLYPHPDHVFVDEERGCIIVRGPLNAQHAEKLEWAAQHVKSWAEERDQLLSDIATERDEVLVNFYKSDLRYANHHVDVWTYYSEGAWSGDHRTPSQMERRFADSRRRNGLPPRGQRDKTTP